MSPSPSCRPRVIHSRLALGILALAACGPKRVVFTPTCRADAGSTLAACRAPMRLVGDSANAFPDYPQIMAAVGVDGRVEVDFVVTPDGTVDTASVTIRSLTNRAFVRNTMQAIDQWRFVALDDPGPLVPMTYSVLVKYQLGKERCTVSYFAVIRRVWSMSGGRPVATVTACQPRLVPRDQIRPMNGPGN